MPIAHYRDLDARSWTKPSTLLVSSGLERQPGLGSYVIVDPAVINTLSGTPTSILSPAAITGSALPQSTINPAQPAADFASTNWITNGWVDPANITSFRNQVRDWVHNNLSNTVLNPGSNDFNIYLLDTTISSVRYLVPIVMLGQDGPSIDIPFSNTESSSAGSYIGTTFIDYSAIPSFSVSLWLNTSSSVEQTLFDNFDYAGSGAGSPNFISLFMNTGGTLNYSVPGGISGSAAGPFNDGAYHHVVYSYDSTANLNIYVDNVLVHTSASTSGSVITNSIPVNISPSANPVVGLLDEVSFFDVALSAGQVSAVFNSGHPGDVSLLANVAHWWRMGDLDDTTSLVQDRVGTLDLNGTGVSFSTTVP